MTKSDLRNYIFDAYQKSVKESDGEYNKLVDEIRNDIDSEADIFSKLFNLREEFLINNIFDAVADTITKLFPDSIDS